MPRKAIRTMIILTILLLLAILLAAAWFSKRYRAQETDAGLSTALSSWFAAAGATSARSFVNSATFSVRRSTRRTG